MAQFPLRLEQYFFTEIQVRANPDFKPAGTLVGSHVDVRSNAGVIEDRTDHYFVDCVVSLDETKSENPPYFFRVNAFGILNASDPDLTDDVAKQHLVRSAGAQVLIGAIRELVAELTSRGPWGVFVVPIIPIAPPMPTAPEPQPEGTGSIKPNQAE
ncbi:MAG: hypothetical protein ACOZCP_12085 [Pseudomonadota bacterium]